MINQLMDEDDEEELTVRYARSNWKDSTHATFLERK
jgi:hypothetical protein